MEKIICFGEVLLRLGPEGYYRFIQADKFVVNYTGAEANVAVALAQFGMKTEVVTKLPNNDIAKAAVATLKKFGAGTENIVYGGDRVGVYFVEKGASQRPSKVVYDRKYSSISFAKQNDFNWDKIFEDASAFIFTGITAALGENLPAILLDACKMARAKGVKVFCDLNYRKNLWTPERAQSVMQELVHYVDVLIGNEEDADKVLGVKAANTDVAKGELDKTSYIDVARKLTERYGCQMIATTLRTSISASDNNWAGMLYTNGKAYFSKEYKIHIVDRVGGGDSFASGLMYGLLNGFESQEALEFAVAASCLKHSIELDFNLVSVSEIEALVKGDGSGRVQR
ncbi:sugar kinase [Geosporobacter ferrireducens]|uniref:2-dehydro-3-deoxygluconokinase n=1 Tax=Geosporobacter ferrireducens TaxID=1424294 RepID=A0A1D8GFG0_9FIRM|nr:sugar kinase [Geosporobacter ferrireducens]AOT69646.1 2-dehydro-3-deoxygluconokinase [Geosporobacter ferrireducens]MTI54649.1 sugar kinase [Geosporobacter ferrireducens]